MKTHGMDGTPTHISWEGMLQRVRGKEHTVHWQNYGARGITVCDEWLKFENFLRDMGERPDNTSLDRIDNDGNYEPGNCRWSSSTEQIINRRGKQKPTRQLVTCRCGNEFLAYKYVLDKGYGKHCSRKCYHDSTRKENN